MMQYTEQQFENMTRNELVAVFTTMMEEIGQLVERSRQVIEEQQAHIDHLHQRVRELEADA